MVHGVLVVPFVFMESNVAVLDQNTKKVKETTTVTTSGEGKSCAFKWTVQRDLALLGLETKQDSRSYGTYLFHCMNRIMTCVHQAVCTCMGVCLILY